MDEEYKRRSSIPVGDPGWLMYGPTQDSESNDRINQSVYSLLENLNLTGDQEADVMTIMSNMSDPDFTRAISNDPVFRRSMGDPRSIYDLLQRTK